MGAIEDLNASVAALSTAVANSTGEITILLNDVLAANASNNSEAIETAVTAINAQVKALNDATAAASAALTPATVTPPAETPAA